MTTTLTHPEGLADAELIAAVRGGDVDAYGELFARHVEAARRLARQLVRPGDVDDLVSDAFAKVLAVLQRGGGPDVAFRAYLLTALRRLHIDRVRSGSKVHHTDDMDAFDPGVPFRDTAVEGFESAAAAKAFASLPERWQLVLWHTEVEGQRPADVAPLLGMTPNSVAALAYRAREGLRQAFLRMHVQEIEDDQCRWTHEHIGGYVRKGLSRRDVAKVESHLEGCRPCTAIYLELTEVNSNLAGVLAPALLGLAAGGYLAAVGGGLAKGGVLAGIIDRAREMISSNAPASVGVAVAAGVVVAGGTFLAVSGQGDVATPTTEGTVAAGSPGDRPAGAPAPGAADQREDPPSDGRPMPASPVTAPSSAGPGTDPSTGPSTDPSTGAAPAQTPTSGPSGAPGTGPGGSPNGGPGSGPSGGPAPDPGSGTPPVSASLQAPGVTPVAGCGTRGSLTRPAASPGITYTADPGWNVTSGAFTVTATLRQGWTDFAGTDGWAVDGRVARFTGDLGTYQACDLAIAADVEQLGQWQKRITITVEGLAPGGSATLVVTRQGAVEFTALDSRCTTPAGVLAACPVSSTPTVFVFESAKFGWLTFQIAAQPGTDDRHPGNNVLTIDPW